MSLDVSALRSLASSLDDLTERLDRLAAQCDETDDTGLDLREVHRQLEASGRRLSSLLRQLSK